MISVCIATYNGENYIERQLSSIISQLNDDDEVIISDDSNNSRTKDIVMNMRDQRINYYNGSHRGTATSNFEKALQRAKGDIIFLSDQDDEWLPNKVEVCLKYLKDYDCIISDNIVLDENGCVLSDSFFTLNKMHSGKFYNLLIRNNYIGCCMAFNRKVLNAILPFPERIPMHDIWIGNVAAFKYKIYFIPEKLIKFYRHEGTSSTTGRKSTLPLIKQVKNRVEMVLCLFSRCVFNR